MTTIPPQAAIAATGLRKSYGDTLALDGIDLQVEEGTIFALLGPNGAGKTTAVQILSSLISPDAGEVRVAGHELAREPDAVRSAIGVTGQFSAVDNLLTGEENLLLMADLYHLDREAMPDWFIVRRSPSATALSSSWPPGRRAELLATCLASRGHCPLAVAPDAGWPPVRLGARGNDSGPLVRHGGCKVGSPW
jgi:ABC-type lipopolysaccharide export system ATPase subunit